MDTDTDPDPDPDPDPDRDPDPDPDREDGDGDGNRDRDPDRNCAESGCDGRAAVRLHVPWAENREVCPACARALVQRDGVVAEPLDADGDGDAWP